MQPAPVVPFTAPAPFTDPLGSRLLIADRPGERLEQLRFAPRFLSAAFESAVRDRVAQVAAFRHPCFARVRRVDRLDGGTGLALVSEHARGVRLSDVLRVAEQHGLELDINGALHLVRQLVPAMAALHQASPGVAHGTLSLDRIVVTPRARIVITEHVLGPALEQLRLSREELWQELHILAAPAASGPAVLDRRADIVQIGAVSLALVLGRQLRGDELQALPDLLASARETTVLGRKELVAAPLRRWLLRALHLDPRGSFQSAADAQEGLDDVLSEDGGYIAAPIALESFLARYHEHAVLPAPQAAVPVAEAAVAPRTALTSAVYALTARTQTPGPTAPAPAARPTRDEQNAVAEVPEVASAAPGSASHVPAAHVEPPQGEAVSSTGHARTVIESEGDKGEAAQRFERAVREAVGDGSARVADPSVAPVMARFAPKEDASDAVNAEADGVILTPSTRRVTLERAALALCAAIALAEGAYIWRALGSRPAVASNGTLSLESQPSGATVTIDDRERGTTPLAIGLTPGPHIVALRTPGGARVLPITIKPGTAHAQYVELAPAATTGAIDLQGGSPGARVLLDGQPRGTAPVLLSDVAPGDHDLVIESRGVAVRQRVAVQAGLTTTVRGGTADAPVADAAAQGWATLVVPFEMQVFEGGRLIGTTAARRLPLSAGRHQLDVVSQTLAFRTSASVDVAAGQETRVPVHLPKVPVAINAIPWAEVWIDGQKAGETPIGGLALAIGPHELLFRHPEFPEQRQAISVKAGAPTRVSVEMSK